jgi:hypothetical protein
MRMRGQPDKNALRKVLEGSNAIRCGMASLVAEERFRR